MALSPTRLTNNMHAETRTQLHTFFDSFKSGLLAQEQTDFDAAIDKLAEAIAKGDSPITVTELEDNAEIIPNTLAVTPALIKDGATLSCSGDGSVNVGFGKVT